MRRWIVCAGLILVCPLAVLAQTPGRAVQLDLVTYKQLGNEIKKLQGQVVLVDFWADFCRPCKEKFPHVMQWHRQYASQGLEVVTVSIDDATDLQAREQVKLFLQQQGALTRNLMLAEKPDVWIPKLKMDSVPTMFLFDRQGQLINRWTGGEINMPQIEKRIAELLAAKNGE